MKKILAFILAAIMLLSLTACGGKDNATPQNTDKPAAAAPATPAPASPAVPPVTDKNENDEKAPAGADSIVMWYGANYYGIHENTFYCPDGAYIDEDDLKDYKEKGSVSSFNVYDDVREYSATGNSYWSRELHSNEESFYEVLPQLYFYGELDAENAEKYPTYSYNVTDLGFQWDGKDMMLIECSYTSDGGFDYNDIFVGIEFDELYWRAKEGGGIEENLSAPMLLGFDIYSPGVELTVDQYAWIAGQLFGVDSGRTWPLEGEEEEPEAPVVNVDASELLGTWLQRDSDWNDTFIFNADGTGAVISGPEYPYTYVVSGDVLTLTYDDGDEEEFTVSVDGDLLTMIDKWGDELLLDKQVEETDEPEAEETETPAEEESGNPYVKEIVGTWAVQDTDYEEVFTFKKDGTGQYSYKEGSVYTFSFTYSFYNGDYVELTYDDDGTQEGFTIRIEGDTMYFSNLSYVDMPLIRQ